MEIKQSKTEKLSGQYCCIECGREVSVTKAKLMLCPKCKNNIFYKH